jgi:hypothetical protein
VHVHVMRHSEGSGGQQAGSEHVGERNHFECLFVLVTEGVDETE